MIQVTNPSRIFYSAKDGTCLVKSKFVSRAISANNITIAAVTGKRIRVIGGTFQTNGAAVGTIQFLDGSAGTLLFSFNMPTNAAPPAFQLPLNEIGYFETSTGIGLYDTVLTTAQIFILYYIEYTP